jgi:hypothetical protein
VPAFSFFCQTKSFLPTGGEFKKINQKNAIFFPTEQSDRSTVDCIKSTDFTKLISAFNPTPVPAALAKTKKKTVEMQKPAMVNFAKMGELRF